MPRHFGPQHIKNGYAAMGGNLSRPIYSSARRGYKSVAESIAAARRAAAAEARRSAKKK